MREAARNADVVIYYQHFQIAPRMMDRYGHGSVESLERWQTDFARAVIDAGATVYIAHGGTGWDGVEIYKGRPIFRQLGALAHQNAGYGRLRAAAASRRDDYYQFFRNILAELTLLDGAVEPIEVLPIDIDHGEAYFDDYSTMDFAKRRGTAELATGPLALDILERFRRLSANYGTEVEIKGERAVIYLNERD